MRRSRVQITSGPPIIEARVRGLNSLFTKQVNESSVGLNPTDFVKNGGVTEWFIVAVLKTVVPERVPWVQILPPPPLYYNLICLLKLCLKAI